MSTVSERSLDWSPRALGRAIALLFLVVLLCGVAAQGFVSDRLISFGDATRTATTIRANESLYRAGFTLYMIEMAAQVASTVLLFHLLRPVNRRVATVALAFGLVGCTIKIVSRVFYLAPLFMLKQGGFAGLTPDQSEAVSLILLHVNDRGAGVALGFFGLETILEGWLIFRSTFLPRWLGALTMVASAGWLTFLSPTLGYRVFNVVALIALAGMVTTIVRLLVGGVDEARWRERAAMAASSL